MSKTLTSKITSVVLSVATLALFAGSMLPKAEAAMSVADLQAQIAALQAQLSALAGGSSTPATSCTFSSTLTVGAKGSAVTCLQNYLTSTGDYTHSGGATGYFGNITKAAVASWQSKHGVSPAAGVFGPISRAKYSELQAVAVTPTPTPTPGPVAAGTGLTVSLASDQPAQGLFGESFASRPFTKLNLTASSDGDVTVKKIVVERVGQSADAVFSGVIALDENYIRYDRSKTFGSDHTLSLTPSILVKAGQTKTVYIAGDSDNNQDAYNGQLAALQVKSVDAGTATVNGSFPMVGTTMTVNSTLAIGSATLTRGTLDPGVSQTKEVGTTGYTFSGIRISAGSNEDITVKAVKFLQSGSASASDLSNVQVVLDGTSYPAQLSSDGKYYTANFGSGLFIQKGLQKEMSIKGDVIGGSNRTVDMNLDYYEDLRIVGATYGYAITPSATDSGDSATDNDGTFQASNPNYDGYLATIGTGTMNVTKANSVTAQNIAINLADQVLGGFDFDVKGEPITIATLRFSLAPNSGSSADTADITNVKLVRADGTVVAGPVDAVAGGTNAVVFTDTVTFNPGITTYKLIGKLGTDFTNNNTVTASTTPGSNWSTIRGTVSNISLTPTPSGAVIANTMTVKAAALSVSVSPIPSAQTIVAGLNGFNFGNFVFDASGSGEDVRTTSFQPQISFGQLNTADDLRACQLFDGATALNTGTNIVNPGNSVANQDNVTFTLDSGVIIPKGSVKTLALKCNVSATTTSVSTVAGTINYTFAWGLGSGASAANTAVTTGLTSGQTVTPTINTNNGQNISVVASGTLSIALDSSSPGARWAAGGTTDNVLNVLRITTGAEDVNLTQIGLILGGGASNTPQDLTKVTLWDGDAATPTKVGEVVFSTADIATATISGMIIPKNSDRKLVIKGDIGAFGVGAPAKPGHLVRVEYWYASGDTSGNGTRGTGLSSGNFIYSGTTASTTASGGVYIAKSYPILTPIALPTNKLIAGTPAIYRFSVTAPSTGGVGLYKFSFRTATAGGTTAVSYQVTNFQTWGYSDSAFSIPAYGSTGLLNSSDLVTASSTATGYAIDDSANQAGRFTIFFNPVAGSGTTNEAIQVPAGQTRYFEVKANVAGVSASTTLSTQLEGDIQTLYAKDAADTFTSGNYSFATTAAYVASSTIFGTEGAGGDGVLLSGSGDVRNDFIWSDNATTTSGVANYDWMNGYLVPGLPGTNMSSQTLTP